MLNITSVFENEASALSTVDDTLIKNIANGSKEALCTLYNLVHKSIYGFALSITKNTHDAEDVLQDTFLAIYQKADSYRGGAKPMAWIFTIAKNFALMKLRGNKNLADIDELEIENTNIFAQIENIEQRIVLKAALGSLNDDECQIIMLHALGGIKNREIAALMNTNINTVLSKYHRAIKKLEKVLTEEGLQ